MQTFPNKIKFTQTELEAELKTIETKDSKGVKLSNQIGVYVYLDNGKARLGKVTNQPYKNDKIGSTVSFSLDALIKLEKEKIVSIL